jgi:hypothetical protein
VQVHGLEYYRAMGQKSMNHALRHEPQRTQRKNKEDFSKRILFVFTPCPLWFNV